MLSKKTLDSALSCLVDTTSEIRSDFLDALLEWEGDYDRFYYAWKEKAHGPGTNSFDEDMFLQLSECHGMFSIMFDEITEKRNQKRFLSGLCGIDLRPIRQSYKESNLPDSYAEIEYSDFDNAEAIDGARWDDMNYQHLTER